MAPVNKATRLLSQESNNELFIKLLEPKCVSLVTSVVDLYYKIDNKWVFQADGVLCFEYDGNLRQYYLRFYKADNYRMIFEQMVHPKHGIEFKYYPTPYIFEIPTDNNVTIGLCFFDEPAGEEEATEFLKALSGSVSELAKPTAEEKAAAKSIKKRLGKKKKISAKNIGAPTDIRHVQHLGTDREGGVVQRDFSNDPKAKMMLQEIGLAHDEIVHNKKCQKMLEAYVNACETDGAEALKLLSELEGLVDADPRERRAKEPERAQSAEKTKGTDNTSTGKGVGQGSSQPPSHYVKRTPPIRSNLASQPPVLRILDIPSALSHKTMAVSESEIKHQVTSPVLQSSQTMQFQTKSPAIQNKSTEASSKSSATQNSVNTLPITPPKSSPKTQPALSTPSSPWRVNQSKRIEPLSTSTSPSSTASRVALSSTQKHELFNAAQTRLNDRNSSGKDGQQRSRDENEKYPAKMPCQKRKFQSSLGTCVEEEGELTKAKDIKARWKQRIESQKNATDQTDEPEVLDCAITFENDSDTSDEKDQR